MIKKMLSKVDSLLPVPYLSVMQVFFMTWPIRQTLSGKLSLSELVLVFTLPWSAYAVELHMIAGNRRLVRRSAVTRWRTQERARQAKELKFYSTLKLAPEGVA
ncbi:hypothetical protein [Alcaligenes phenolicus]|uniref:Uncharacterized protein n=1 Tax=Alcaligenes phenolicus TaxID=232846 RepID=A0AAW5W068_9BURK|nr:hypothetical protein [Alcaligenes phenolicus]MCX5565792.1 hypothetical protein [Alcaligenes phenolicus]